MFYDKNQQVFNMILITCVKFFKENIGFVEGNGYIKYLPLIPKFLSHKGNQQVFNSFSF